jgi:hypothetical protein
VHADAVLVGVFLKSDRKLAELRPKSRWLSCYLYLPREIADPRVARSMRLSAGRLSAGRVVNEIKLCTPGDVDDQLLGWLEEAFDEATD